MPLISVIIPVYKCEEYLESCVSSILNQTFKDFELYIVDDCSTDSSWDIIQSIEDDRVIKIRNPKNLGEPVSADFFKSLKGRAASLDLLILPCNLCRVL
jgi:glycosyltransferase involved in cell wall biosynthesis